jgi:hypothetical protein
MINICGNDYEFDKPYEFKSLADKRDAIKRIFIENRFYSYLPPLFRLDKVTEDGKLTKRIKRFLENIYITNIYHDELSKQKLIQRINNVLKQVSEIKDDEITYTVILKKLFNWPEGYFQDHGKCWHSSNYSSPVCFQEHGAIWITIYKDGAGYTRCGYWPEYQTFFNSAGKLNLRDITLLFDTFDKYDFHSVSLFNEGYDCDDRVLYFNNSLRIFHKDTHRGSDKHIYVDIDEDPYYMDICDECGTWLIEKYKNDHICESTPLVYDPIHMSDHKTDREIGQEYEKT